MPSKYELHAVIIKNTVKRKDADKMAQDIIKDKSKTFMRQTQDSYRYRNIAKTKFKESSFRSKVISPDITLVFGELK